MRYYYYGSNGGYSSKCSVVSDDFYMEESEYSDEGTANSEVLYYGRGDEDEMEVFNELYGEGGILEDDLDPNGDNPAINWLLVEAVVRERRKGNSGYDIINLYR